MFYFILPIIKSSYCGSYLPKDETSCDKFTHSTNICCHLTGKLYGTIQSMCYPFVREDYYRMKRTVGINEFNFKLKCGNKRGASCGQVVNPVTYKDCSIYSESKNSCCYYTYKGTTNCVWLGNSNVGTMKYKDLLLICKGTFLQYWVVNLALFLVLI